MEEIEKAYDDLGLPRLMHRAQWVKVSVTHRRRAGEILMTAKFFLQSYGSCA